MRYFVFSSSFFFIASILSLSLSLVMCHRDHLEPSFSGYQLEQVCFAFFLLLLEINFLFSLFCLFNSNVVVVYGSTHCVRRAHFSVHLIFWLILIEQWDDVISIQWFADLAYQVEYVCITYMLNAHAVMLFSVLIWRVKMEIISSAVRRQQLKWITLQCDQRIIIA